jgi:hypothetical protein
MTDISPAAQAVLDATGRKNWYRNDDIAAALRAASDQVVPHEYLTGVDAAVEARQLTRLRLLAIAAELESL